MHIIFVFTFSHHCIVSPCQINVVFCLLTLLVLCYSVLAGCPVFYASLFINTWSTSAFQDTSCWWSSPFFSSFVLPNDHHGKIRSLDPETIRLTSLDLTQQFMASGYCANKWYWHGHKKFPDATLRFLAYCHRFWGFSILQIVYLYGEQRKFWVKRNKWRRFRGRIWHGNNLA